MTAWMSVRKKLSMNTVTFKSVARRRACCLAMFIVALSATVAQAGPRWLLIYRRQIGNFENANRMTIENHLFREDGSRGAYVGVTNRANASFAIFGQTDINGWNRINPLDTNNCAYDIKIYDPSVPTDETPDFYWINPPGPATFYCSYITQWLYVADDTGISTFPARAVYDYDLMNGELNQVVNLDRNTCIAEQWIQPEGVSSDIKELTHWRNWHAQTFVVPEGINRIISFQAFAIRGYGDPPFQIVATIREGGPTGPQVGPSVTSRVTHNSEFKEAATNWGIDDVHVVPGQTYALHISAADGQGFNVYATNTEGIWVADKYPQGALYMGGVELPDQDMFATIVGIGVYDDVPAIALEPEVITPTVEQGQNPSSDTFTVRNAATGTLNYTINDNAAWLSVSPTAGTATTETDTINIQYHNVASLPVGVYNARITVSDVNAMNSPQIVNVQLSVLPPPAAPGDMDRDGDVDQEDFGHFQACYSGAGIPQYDFDCLDALLDTDEDVDHDDFGVFQQCFTGPNVIADLNCAE